MQKLKALREQDDKSKEEETRIAAIKAQREEERKAKEAKAAEGARLIAEAELKAKQEADQKAALGQ